MGGIVAAETVIALTTDRVIPVTGGTTPGQSGGDGNHTAAPAEDDTTPLNTLMFPYIQAVLSFDTPYLGISPGVVAHGAETHYSTATAALTQLSTLSSLWSAGGNTQANNANANDNKAQAEKQPVAALEASKEATSSGNGGGGAGSTSSWGSWGKMAMYAGAGAALAGGAAAAYLKRDTLTEGWTWVSSHLEFVGCLARGEELRRRMNYMVRAHRELGVGFGNLYTRLGQGATAKQQLGGTNMVGTVMGTQRTFCNLPSRRGGPEKTGVWEEAMNEVASDETWAHMCECPPLPPPPLLPSPLFFATRPVC